MNSFTELNLPKPLKLSLERLDFKKPTPIQAAAIPLVLTGKDLIGCAQTGTGKTAAFCLPALTKIMQRPEERVLVLAPTRELAFQIRDVIHDLTDSARHLKTALLIGGMGMGSQMKALKAQPSVVIATPGRLLDHHSRGTIDLSRFHTVILDEADRMLDMGFAASIESIFQELPSNRQTLLFSATLPPTILKLSQKYLREPERITVGAVQQTVQNIKIHHIELPGTEKNDRVLQELKTRSGSVLIFTRTKIRADRLARFLKTNGVKAGAIHGGRSQGQRLEALNRFREGSYPILVATDVASRGLDIPQIELVINFDLPQTREDYMHRVGRTARAGAEGEALSFVTPEETQNWLYISKAEGAHNKPRQAAQSKKKSFWKKRPSWKFARRRSTHSKGRDSKRYVSISR